LSSDIADAGNRPDDMPFEAISFRLRVFKAGDTARVMVYFSGEAPEGTKWYKYDLVNGWQDYSDHAALSSDRRSVMLELKDGGFGDGDGTENSIIIDPSGLGIASSIIAAPHLSGWKRRLLYRHGGLWIDSGAAGQTPSPIPGSFSVDQYFGKDFHAVVLSIFSANGKIHFRARKFADGCAMRFIPACGNQLGTFEIRSFADIFLSAVSIDLHNLWGFSQR
jgi:hypothetical protein